MKLFTKIKNLRKVTGRLKNRKFLRAKEIIQDYGIRELFRRVGEKMASGDVPSGRIYVVTNESYSRNTKNPSGYHCESSVAFTILPGALNVGKLEILTQNPQGNATLTLQVYDTLGNELLNTSTANVMDGAYTSIDFLPLLDYTRQKRKFVLTYHGTNGGILVNRKKSRRSFQVEGGGSIICRVYTRLDALYMHWMLHNTPTSAQLNAQHGETFAYMPKISIVVPLFNTPIDLLQEMIQSVTAQTYANWELCLADGSTNNVNLEPTINSFKDARILYKKLEKNEGISGNTNCALQLATGEYIGLLDHDDTLAPHALYSYIKLINKDPSYDFIYSDEDKITADGSRRFDPFFKPHFSPNMLLAFNYITHFSVIKKSLLDKVGWLRDEYNGAQDYDLFLRATEAAQKIGHIDDVLYHWRIIETSTAFSSNTKSYTVEAGKKALEAAIERRHLSAHVELGTLPNYYNVVYHIPQPLPFVSIIIPNHNQKATLRKCATSILSKSTYPNFELIIVENNSTDASLFDYYEVLKVDPRVKIVQWDHPFNFSALNNFAASQAQGDLLLFMNNDMSIITPDWLQQMVMHAIRPEIGAVGAKLLYPDNTIQHGGVVLRIGGIAGHSHKFMDSGEVGAFARMTLVHDVSAVTGACVMLRREIFKQVQGFDEAFTVAYNDVDLSLRIRLLGYSIVWTPYAQLYHFESKTRGYEDTPEKEARLAKEAALWRAKWEKKYPYDPFYSRNLTQIYEDYSIRPEKNDP